MKTIKRTILSITAVTLGLSLASANTNTGTCVSIEKSVTKENLLKIDKVIDAITSNKTGTDVMLSGSNYFVRMRVSNSVKEHIDKLDELRIPINSCNLMIAEDIGVNGLVFMRTGKAPSAYTNSKGDVDLDILKEVVRATVGEEHWTEMEANGLTDTQEGLGKAVKLFMDKKYGVDVLSDNA